MTKNKPCTKGPKHTWIWLHDTKIIKGSLRCVQVSLRGVYLCDCGEKKLGTPRGGIDLRGVAAGTDGVRVAGATIAKAQP